MDSQKEDNLPTESAKDDIMSYAGLFSGCWGDTLEEVEEAIRELRNSWER